MRRVSESSKKRERVAALRAQQAKQRAAEARRRQLMLIVGPIVTVVLVVAIFVVAKAMQGKTHDKGPVAANASVVQALTSIPAATLDAAGGGAKSTLLPVKGKAILTAGGKPELLYMGAEFCPYCAAERWPMIIALSRFGSFTGLQETHSSSTDVFASTPTWTFRKATYTSPYLTFESVETEDVNSNPLQTPTAQQQALLVAYDAPPYVPSSAKDSIPFIDFGNQFVISGAGDEPGTLDGNTQAQITTALANPASPIAKTVLPIANQITAGLCKIMSNKDTTVCTDPVITKIEAGLGA